MRSLRNTKIGKVLKCTPSKVSYYHSSLNLVNHMLFAGPSAPESLDIIGVNSSSVMLQWRPPLTPNGVIVLYSLKYNSTTLLVTNTSSDVLMLTVEGLSSENVYIFQVTAHTKAGEGPPINLTVVIRKLLAT